MRELGIVVDIACFIFVPDLVGRIAFIVTNFNKRKEVGGVFGTWVIGFLIIAVLSIISSLIWSIVA